MMIVRCPDNNFQERSYIIEIILKDFLGLEYQVEVQENFNKYEIILRNQKKIIIKDSFFCKYEKPLSYLKLENIPNNILWFKHHFTNGESIPILYGTPDIYIYNDTVFIGIDIFASSFFMLTRWEEFVNTVRDEHGRFPGKESIAYKNDFLDKPIVNQYLETLKNVILYLDNNIKFKKHKKKTFVTCDLDYIYKPHVNSLYKTARKAIGDLVKRRNAREFISTIKDYVSSCDSYYKNIFYIMDINEKFGNIVDFYIIPLKTSHYDPYIKLDKIKSVIEIISIRGHKIGVHPGYETYNNPKKLKKTIDEFMKLIDIIGVKQENFGGRQHFLRWDSSITPLLWSKNALSYDTTLSYADIAGFRCGVCYEFPLFDYLNRQKLNTNEIPLIAMDISVIGNKYEGLGFTEKALYRFLELKEKCHRYNGIFTLLWHNSFFESDNSKEIYETIIK